jgi:hypothetical protein
MLETCRQPFDLLCARDRCFAGRCSKCRRLFRQKETRERLPATWHALACSRCAPDHHMIGITNLKTAFEFYEWIVSKGTLVFPMIGIGRHARRYQAARRRA